MTAKNKNNIVANVPNLRFPEFEGEWKECGFSDIGTFFKGTGISKEQLTEIGTPCILYGELYTTYKNEVIKVVKSKTTINTNGLFFSKSNDVIIPSSGETAIDISTACCVLLDNILLGGDLNIIRPEKHDGSFISYQLNGKRKYDIAKIAQGSSIIHLYNDSLKKLKVYAPKYISEEEKIATLLSLLDDRISTQSKSIKELETLMKGLIHSFIREKEVNIQLKDCLNCHSSTLMESAVQEKSGIYPVYGATGIIVYTTDYEVYKDAILIIKDGAGVGKVQYAKDKYSVIGTLNYLIAKENVSLKYLYYYLMIFNFDKYKVGSGIPHIYFKDYGNEYIYCPPIEEQCKIANFLSAIDEKLETEKQILKKYIEQKKYLLVNMFV